MALGKVVLTGAAGALGKVLRGPLSNMAETLVSTDQVDDIGKLAANETYVQSDVGDYDAVHALMAQEH